MKGKKQLLSALMVMAFLVALPGIGVWGAQDPERQGPEYIFLEDVEVQKDTPTIFFRDSVSGANDWWLRAYHGSSPDWFEIYDWTNGRRIFTVEAGGPNDSIFIEDTGDIGFGDSTPSYSLDIYNSSPDLRLYSTSIATSVFYVYDDGTTTANNDTGDGFRGYADSATGNWWGVFGRSYSPDGEGVIGVNYALTGDAHGVYGETASTDGHAVQGYAYNSSGSAFGVYGESDAEEGTGVHGQANAATGRSYGVTGQAESRGGRGVYGFARSRGGSSIGIFGVVRSPDGWAGQFNTSYGNGVYVTAPAGKAGLNVASGTKSAVVATQDGSRLLYTEESTAVWFTDYGFGQLQDGVAVVTINPFFAQTVNLEQPYHVFVEEYGDAQLYVSQRTPGWFEVRLGGRRGDANVAFSYRLVAMRLGYEGTYMERAPWADQDPNLYPEYRDAFEASIELEPATERAPEALSPKALNAEEPPEE